MPEFRVAVRFDNGSTGAYDVDTDTVELARQVVLDEIEEVAAAIVLCEPLKVKGE